VLVRCARCHAVYSVQDGLTGPVQRTFSVECGRCHAIFEAQSSQISDAARTPAPRRLATPPLQKAAAMTLPASAPGTKSRRAAADESSDAGALRPAIYGPVAKRNPLTTVGAVAVGIVAVAALASWLVLDRTGVRPADTKADEARSALFLDDDASLDRAVSLFAEAARSAAVFEADRAFALLLRGSAKRDLADRREAAARSDPSVAAQREADLRDGAQLVQKGAAAAREAVDSLGDDLAALRAMALAAALTSGNPKYWLGRAGRKAGDDALFQLAVATAELAGGRDGEAQDRAAAALAAAKRIAPRLLRAQVDAAALALDRHDLAAARRGLQAVLEANPQHERAKVLLSLVAP
jgi:hypothetical protein